MDNEALIHAVEIRKCLYDKTDDNYSNRNFLTAEWRKIADEVGCNENDARKRWKQLRDYFLKAQREMTTQKSGSAGGVKKKWYLYDRLLFIKPFLNDRKTTTNMEPLSSEEDLENEENISQSQTRSTSLFVEPYSTPTPTTTPSPTTPTPTPSTVTITTAEMETQNTLQSRKRRQRAYPQQRAAQSGFESEMLQAAKRLGQKREDNIDEDEYFLKSLVPKMKLLNTIDKMECQAELHMIVLKYVKKSSNMSDGNVHPHSARELSSPSIAIATSPTFTTTSGYSYNQSHNFPESYHDYQYRTQYGQYPVDETHLSP